MGRVVPCSLDCPTISIFLVPTLPSKLVNLAITVMLRPGPHKLVQPYVSQVLKELLSGLLRTLPSASNPADAAAATAAAHLLLQCPVPVDDSVLTLAIDSEREVPFFSQSITAFFCHTTMEAPLSVFYRHDRQSVTICHGLSG